MNQAKELNLNEMAQVSGGTIRVVNTNTDDKAAVRSDPYKGKRNQIDALANGTQVDTVDDQLVYDAGSGRNYVQIRFTDKNGNVRLGWIAASIIGLPR